MIEEHGVLVRKILEMKRGIDEMERRGQVLPLAGDSDAPHFTQLFVRPPRLGSFMLMSAGAIIGIQRRVPSLWACFESLGYRASAVAIFRGCSGRTRNQHGFVGSSTERKRRDSFPPRNGRLEEEDPNAGRLCRPHGQRNGRSPNRGRRHVAGIT